MFSLTMDDFLSLYLFLFKFLYNLSRNSSELISPTIYIALMTLYITEYFICITDEIQRISGYIYNTYLLNWCQ